MTKYTLSVIMGNYNKAPFIPLTMESLLNQSRPADEIIVVDDASTDNSVEVISSYLARHPSMRLVRNPVNRGANHNVNTLIKVATGDIVYFASSDDCLYPEFFQRGMELLEAHPEAALFSARCDLMDMNSRNLGLMPSAMPRRAAGYLSPEECFRALPRHDSWLVGLVTLFKRNRLIQEGGFPEDLGSVADNFVSQILALKDGACFDPAPLAAWRQSESGVSWDNSINIDAARRISDLCARRMIESGKIFPEGYPERWRRRYMFGAYRLGLSHARKGAAKEGFLQYGAAWLHEAFLSAWLFMKLRPWDLTVVLNRRLHVSNLKKVPPR